MNVGEDQIYRGCSIECTEAAEGRHPGRMTLSFFVGSGSLRQVYILQMRNDLSPSPLLHRQIRQLSQLLRFCSQPILLTPLRACREDMSMLAAELALLQKLFCTG